MLKFSIFLVKLSKGNQVALFHSLSPFTPIIVNSLLWSKFLRDPLKYQKSRFFVNLYDHKLLIESDQVDQKELKKARESFLRLIPSVPSTLYLILTEGCNLKCKYCPFSKFESSGCNPSSMSLSIAKKGIDFWVNTHDGSFGPKRIYNIIFYGGEPLLNSKVLRKSLDYIHLLRSKNKLLTNLRILLDTNGTLLTKRLALLLKKHKVEVTIALDDFSPINDIYRVDFEGKGTFKKVIKVLKMLRDLDVTTYLSTALTPENLEKIKDFPKYLKEYKIKGLGINIIRGYSFREGRSKGKVNFNDYQNKSAQIIEKFFWSSKDKGIIEFQAYRRYFAFNSKTFYANNCGGFGEHIVIHPRGEIGNCPWTTSYLLGNISKEKNYSLIKKKNFFFTRKENLPLYNKECLRCEAISICGGKCVWADDLSKGKTRSFCILSKRILQSLIWKNGVKFSDGKRQN